MNALFVKDLTAKTHRGLRRRVEQGRSRGGLCYGYDVVKHTNADGEPIRGKRRINETGARIARRVFREFAPRGQPARHRAALECQGQPWPGGSPVDRLHPARACQARHGAD